MATRRPTREKPPALGLVSRRPLPESQQAAWWADLSRFVEEVRETYPYLWPAKRPESAGLDIMARVRKRPWPECWAAHPGLVEDLVAVKVWQTGLLAGSEWAGGPPGWCAWRAYLDAFATQVQVVSQRCFIRHEGAFYTDPEEPMTPVPAVAVVGDLVNHEGFLPRE